MSWCCEQHVEGEGRAPELMGRGERGWCKRSRAGRVLGVQEEAGTGTENRVGVFGWVLLREALKRGQGLLLLRECL